MLFYLLYGKEPNLPSNIEELPKELATKMKPDDYRTKLLQRLKLAKKLIKDNISAAQEKQKRFYDQRRVIDEYK